MIWPSAQVLESFGAANAAVTTLDGGHVHHTFAVRAPDQRALLIQAVNPAVIGDAWALAERTLVVAEALAAHPDPMLTDRLARRTRDREPAVRDANGIVWRAFELIDQAVEASALANPPSPGTVAHLFGRFGRRAAAAQLAPFSSKPFHDLGRRLGEWNAARRAPLADVPSSLERDLEDLVHLVEIPSGLPPRMVHNDAKPANLLVDARSGSALSIIDLDLVDQGTIVDDAGDLIRSQVFRADLLDVDRVADVLDGYLNGLEPLLDRFERGALARSGEVITLELALRRLVDHVAGSGYFADAHDGENLDQAGVQLTRARALVARRAEIDALSWRLSEEYRAPSTG